MLNTPRYRLARIVSHLVPIGFAALAIGLAISSTLSYEPLKAYVDSLSADGTAEAFTPRLHASLVLSARIGAAALALAAAGLWMARRAVTHWLGSVASQTGDYMRDGVRGGVRALRDESPGHLAALLGIVVLGIALRARVLSQPMNYDESYTYLVYASRPWFIAWSNYSEPNNHLLHTLLAHVSTQAFGNGAWAIRLPAFLAGCLTIPLSYVVARRLAGRREALIAATLVATTQILIAFSVCARGYTIVIDLFLLALLCGYDIVTTRSTHPWPLFAALCAAGFFTIPVFVYPYGALMGWLFLAGRRDPQNPALRMPVLLRNAVWTLALVVMCYAPALATTGVSSGVGYAAQQRSFGQFMAHVLHSLHSTESDLLRGLPDVVAVAMTASGLIGAAHLWRAPGGWILLAPLGLVPAALMLLQRTMAPGRVWTYLLPVFFLYGAAGVIASAEWIARRLPRIRPTPAALATAAVPFAFVVSALVQLPNLYTEWNAPMEVTGHVDLDEVARYLKTTLRPQDALVLAFPLDYPMEYYLRVNDVPLEPFSRPPSHPERLVVLANDSTGETIHKVLAAKHLAPTTAPTLLRRFAYSSLYEIRPQGSAQ